MVAGSGTGAAELDEEKLAVVPAVFPVKDQVAGVSSKSVMCAIPAPSMDIVLVELERYGPRQKIYPPSYLSFGPSTALHPPAHIHQYALAGAPCLIL
jgi:hypothetical protein